MPTPKRRAPSATRSSPSQGGSTNSGSARRWTAAGRRQTEIAATLGLSERTVENHGLPKDAQGLRQLKAEYASSFQRIRQVVIQVVAQRVKRVTFIHQ